MAIVLALVGREVRKAKREQHAYHKLVALGATGDDWIGWRELILGREYAPIVQISIPSTVSLDEAVPLLSNLDNLESLDIWGESIEEPQLEALSQLKSVKSLRLSSTKVNDDAQPHLARFTFLEWLDIQNTQISDEGVRLLEQQLPTCRIER